MKLTQAESNAWLNDGYFIRQGNQGLDQGTVQQLLTRAMYLKTHLTTCRGHEYLLDNKRFVDIEGCTLQYEFGEHANTLRVVEPIHHLDQVFSDLVDDPRITRPMQGLVGTSKLALWTAKMNYKTARIGSAFGWHQDSPYWIHDTDHVDRLPNVMIALDPQAAGTGCFRVISGSHTQGILSGTDDGSQLGGFYTDTDQIDPHKTVDIEVPPGALIFFHPHLIHGSDANKSDHDRCALILTYQPSGFPTLKHRRVRNVDIPAAHIGSR